MASNQTPRKAERDQDGAKCQVCSAPMVTDALFCGRCGAPQPGAPKCPHCGAVAGTSRSPELGTVCNVCGAPRVVVSKRGLELSGGEVAPLGEARSVRRARAGWRIVGGLASGATVLVLGLTLLGTLLTGALGAVFGVALSVPFLVLALVAFSRSGAATRRIKGAMDDAWRSAARDVVRQSAQGITAAELQQILPLSETEVERLLAELAVDDSLRSDVTDDGRLSFSPAVRIDIGQPGASAVGPTEIAEMEEADDTDEPVGQKARGQ